MPNVYPVAFEGQSPEEFGRAASRIGIVTIPLDNARQQQEFTIGGTMLWAINASTIGAQLTVQFQDYTSAEIPYSKGLSIRGVRYSKLYLTNEAQAGEFITLLYAVEAEGGLQIDNPLQDADAANITGIDPGVVLPVSESDYFDTFDSLADQSMSTTPAQIVAASSVKRELILQADANNTDDIIIGDSGIGTANGIRIAPGQNFIINSKGEVYGRSVSGSQNLRVISNTA